MKIVDETGMRKRLTGQTPDTSSMRSDVKEVALVTSPVTWSSEDTATTCKICNSFDCEQKHAAGDDASGACPSADC